MNAIWSLGFRPFFLFGITWSMVELVLWVCFQAGWLASLPLADSVIWHAHELVFGYVIAIVAGFLLTASQNWTGKPGVKGMPLRTLVGIWGLARILSFFWEEAPLLFALIDLAFLPTLALLLLPYLGQAGQRKNQVFLLLFLVLFALNLLTHLHVLGVSLVPARTALYAAVHVVLLMIAVIGGRVIPFFASAVNPSHKATTWKWLEAAAVGTLVLYFVAAFFQEHSPLTAVIAFVAAAAQLVRWLLWKPWRSMRIPVLFVLFFAYLWLPLGLVLKGLSFYALVAPSAALHAFTVGCIGIMIYGMITRVALGHTGRPIRPLPVIVFGYLLMALSALARVVGPIVAPEFSIASFTASGTLWVAAHAIFLVVYTPILLKPRADGRPG